jgi:hypothetical protein
MNIKSVIYAIALVETTSPGVMATVHPKVGFMPFVAFYVKTSP